MPDPILTLADFPRAAAFTLAGVKGRIIPQRMAAGSDRHHTRMFYLEYPVESGTVYQISTSKLANLLGNGAADRSFSAIEAAHVIASIPKAFEPDKVFRAISIPL